MMSQMIEATTMKQKHKIAKEYTDYYKSQDIEGAMKNILRLVATDSTDTQPNLFHIYCKKHKCNIAGLSQFMLIILSLVFSGSKQMSAFSFLTKKSQVDESLKAIYDEVENAKHQYEKQVWSCYESAIRRAKRKTNDIMASNPDMAGSQLSLTIYNELSEYIPWYKWSVASLKELGNFEHLSLDNRYCVYDAVGYRGRQFFLVEHNYRDVLVMWEDHYSEIRGCHEIDDTNTFVSFQLCENCVPDALLTSNDTLSGERCPEYFESAVWNTCGFPENTNKKLQKELKKYSFLAVGSSQHKCSESTCRHHGYCRPIPYTNRHMCFCHPHFTGPNCDAYYNPADYINASTIIASVRNSFSNFIGVPDASDVYLKLQHFPNHLQEMQQNIAGLQKYNIKLLLYGGGFVKAELVAEKFNQLHSGNMTEGEFGKEFVKLNIDFENIFWNLKTMITGEGLLISEGLLTSLMKSQRADCTVQYKEKITRFMEDLLILDEEVTEAQLRFLTWKLHNKIPSEEQELLLQMSHIKDMAVARRESYLQHWEKNSCPELSAENLIEKGCTKWLSYEGMSVTLNCSQGMMPSVPSVTCQKVNGTLEWSARPICQYVWSTWSSCSICSKTCGGGERRRTRQTLNGETDTETQNCETQECCHSRYGTFKCDNGQCVSIDSVCDGKFDCSDGSDESEARECNYLRDGDTVALKNEGTGFMSWDDSRSYKTYIQTTTCPGVSMNRNDWQRCETTQLTLKLLTEEGRRAIRFGDEISIISNVTKACINCLKHGDPKYCRFIDSGKLFCKTKIFARNRLGSCKGHVGSNCKGQPIHPGDVVFLMQGNEWISVEDEWVDLKTCPGMSITPATPCKAEQWTVFRY